MPDDVISFDRGESALKVKPSSLPDPEGKRDEEDVSKDEPKAPEKDGSVGKENKR